MKSSKKKAVISLDSFPIGKSITWTRKIQNNVLVWITPWATVWDNGTWHTWDEKGEGGANSIEHSITEAMQQATIAALRQGFIKK